MVWLSNFIGLLSSLYLKQNCSASNFCRLLIYLDDRNKKFRETNQNWKKKIEKTTIQRICLFRIFFALANFIHFRFMKTNQ